MAEIPGIVFQEPGGQGAGTAAEKTVNRSAAAQPEETGAAANEEATAPRPEAESAEPATPDVTPQTDGAPRRRRAPGRRAQQQQQAFPVHVVKPHPLAFERAQEILESSGSYTKILPGDEPGTVIIR